MPNNISPAKKDKFELLTSLVQAKIPEFSNKTKDQSFLFKIIGPIVSVFNKTFLTGYVTTIGNTVYWPDEKTMKTDWAWKVLAHEVVHVFDNKRQPILFPIKYLFPQILALLSLGALGAFWNLWCLLFLIFLLALLPLPAPGRTWAEMRGYTMTAAVEELWYNKNAEIQNSYLFNWIISQFTSMAYYRMCPNKEVAEAQLKSYVELIKNGDILLTEENEPYRLVHQMLVDLGEI